MTMFLPEVFDCDEEEAAAEMAVTMNCSLRATMSLMRR